MCSSSRSFARSSSTRRFSRSGSLARAGRTIRYGISSPPTDTASSDSSSASFSAWSLVSSPKYPSQANRQSSRTRAPPFTARPMDLTWSSSVRFLWRS